MPASRRRSSLPTLPCGKSHNAKLCVAMAIVFVTEGSRLSTKTHLGSRAREADASKSSTSVDGVQPGIASPWQAVAALVLMESPADAFSLGASRASTRAASRRPASKLHHDVRSQWASPLLSSHGDARAQAPGMIEETLENVRVTGTLEALEGQVMVRMRKGADMTAGGLLLASDDEERPKDAMVVLAGPGKYNPYTNERAENPVKAENMVLMKSLEKGTMVDYNGITHYLYDLDKVIGFWGDQGQTIDGFTPLGDLVLIEPSAEELETSSGLVLTAGFVEQDTQNVGQVLKVGPGTRVKRTGELMPVAVAPGENVVYKRAAITEVMMQGKKLVVVGEQDCLGKW